MGGSAVCTEGAPCRRTAKEGGWTGGGSAVCTEGAPCRCMAQQGGVDRGGWQPVLWAPPATVLRNSGEGERKQLVLNGSLPRYCATGGRELRQLPAPKQQQRQQQQRQDPSETFPMHSAYHKMRGGAGGRGSRWQGEQVAGGAGGRGAGGRGAGGRGRGTTTE
eukprot:309598-Chlamydomonas_euryale.AAC.1